MSHMVFHHSNCIHMLANTGKPKRENITLLFAELPTHPLQPKHAVFTGDASTLSAWSTVPGNFPKYFMLHKTTQQNEKRKSRNYRDLNPFPGGSVVNHQDFYHEPVKFQGATLFHKASDF